MLKMYSNCNSKKEYRNTAIAIKERMEKFLIQTQKENQEKSEEKQREYQHKQMEYQKEMEQKQLKYQKEMEEKQLEFQKQVLELTSRGKSIENKFSFSQNTIWSAIENFSYSPEEDITFASYFRRSVKFQLDSRSDLTIINLQIWKKLG